ncbi:MAG TPA: HesA/MoeB/ThiF family protein [Gammaproteobacteria bacterium]|nr:HesA/MoeB/ThiF family protein [Gammaproteobacteria bacterium]
MDRYQRQMLLPEIGVAGQKRLTAARVLVIGAGGLGSSALYYLAAAGIGILAIVDDDRVERSNLHRQILYADADIGRNKAEAAAERLAAFNPDIRIEPKIVRFDAGNAMELLARCDLVIDATDRLATKFLINDAAAKAARPLVHASALGFEARVALFDASRGPCLRCLFPAPPEIPPATCAEAGVLGAVLGMAGSMQALEAIRWILAAGDDRSLREILGRLWLFDGRSLATRIVALPRDPACEVCRHRPEDICLEDIERSVSDIAAEELERLADALFVDVREREEWDAGHLSGALHLPLSRLAQADRIELPPSRAYVVYCAHGLRSQTAARILLAAGYRNVRSLSGGLAALHGERSPPLSM